MGKPLSTCTSCTLPSLPITASSTTVPSIRARPASGGYVGATSWIRFASAIREAIRILLAAGDVFASTGTGTLCVPFRTSVSAPPGTPPTNPPGTPPTTPPVVPTGGGGASCVICIAVGMLILFEVYVGVGTRNVVTAEAAAGGGTNNIVSVSRLGSVSV